MNGGDTDVVRGQQFTPVDTAGIGKGEVAKAKGDAALGGGGLGVDPSWRGSERAAGAARGRGRAGGARGRTQRRRTRAAGRLAAVTPPAPSGVRRPPSAAERAPARARARAAERAAPRAAGQPLGAAP